MLARVLQAGTRVGRYVLVAELGRGGMGVVWRAAAADGAHVALKFLRADDGTTPDRSARFLREALALARLRHPHVLRVLEAGHHEGAPFLALELVEGQSLLERLIKDGQLPIAEAVALTRKLCAALVHAHSHGVLHRDLKPANVLLRRDGQPVLADFGLTRDVDPVSDEASGPVTLPGKVIGTPGYWSPEQARGDLRRIGPPSDVWGLGALLVTMLTGEPPYGHLETFGQALAAIDRPPPRPSAARREVDARLDRICARAMALEPGERHPGPAELDLELAAWERERASDRLSPAAPTTDVAAPAAPAPRRRWDALVGALIVGVGLLAIGLTAWLAGGGQPEPAARPPAPVPTAAPPPPSPGPPAPPPATGPQDLPRGRTVWRGSYVCNRLETTLELTLDHDPWTRLSATFAFSASPGAPDLPAGSYRVRGRWDPATRRVTLEPEEWIACPGPSWIMVGLAGQADEPAERISGFVTLEGCGKFELVRQRPR